MSEFLGHPVIVVLHENGERIPIGPDVVNIEKKSGGVRIIRQEHTNIPTLVSPEDEIEIKDF